MNIHRKRVIPAKSDENITQFPASSESLSMASAIVKDDTAAGAAKTAMRVTNSTPRNPAKAARGRNTAGTTTSLPTTEIMRFLQHLLMLEKLKDAPRMISAIGVVTCDISSIMDSMSSGT